MDKELKTAKEKDSVLRMAKDRKTIQMSAHSEDDYRRIVGIAYDIKKDGYIGIADATGSLSLWLTPTGELFLQDGGHVSEYKIHKNKESSSLWKSSWVQATCAVLITTVFGIVFTPLITKLVKNYIKPLICNTGAKHDNTPPENINQHDSIPVIYFIDSERGKDSTNKHPKNTQRESKK